LSCRAHICSKCRTTRSTPPATTSIEQPQLGGRAPYYNDEALKAAGAQIQNAESWKPNAVVDREVITGQQPFSDTAFAEALIAQLEKAGK
jgi:putative intracellular protease/amidase